MGLSKDAVYPCVSQNSRFNGENEEQTIKHFGNPYFETNSDAVGHHFSDFQVPIWLPDTWFLAPNYRGLL